MLWMKWNASYRMKMLQMISCASNEMTFFKWNEMLQWNEMLCMKWHALNEMTCFAWNEML